MSFNNPSWLWGFAGLLIPLVIHLLSRKEGPVIKIGSLRFLNETATQQFKSIKLNEIFLLILRMIIVVVLVIFLIDLRIRIFTTHDNWALIDSQIKNEPSLIELLDSLNANKYKIKLLQQGFPDFDENLVINKTTDYWNLVEKLQHEPFQEAIIISNTKASGFFGNRVSLPGNIRWVTIPPHQITTPIYASRFARDSVHIVELGSNYSLSQTKSSDVFWPSTLQYYKTNIDSVLIDTTTINIHVRFDQGFQHDANILYKALQVIQNKVKFKGVLSIDQSEDLKMFDYVIWLSYKPTPDDFKGKLISYREIDNKSLLEKNTNREWNITRRINSSEIIKEHLPLELAKIICPDLTEKLSIHDQRVMPENTMWSLATGKDVIKKENQKNASSFLLIILMAVIVLERIIAYWKNS